MQGTAAPKKNMREEPFHTGKEEYLLTIELFKNSLGKCQNGFDC